MAQQSIAALEGLPKRAETRARPRIRQERALKELAARGWTNIVRDGRFGIWATSPSGSRGLFDPRDLLRELLDEEAGDPTMVAASLPDEPCDGETGSGRSEDRPSPRARVMAQKRDNNGKR